MPLARRYSRSARRDSEPRGGEGCTANGTTPDGEVDESTANLPSNTPIAHPCLAGGSPRRPGRETAFRSAGTRSGRAARIAPKINHLPGSKTRTAPCAARVRARRSCRWADAAATRRKQRPASVSGDGSGCGIEYASARPIHADPRLSMTAAAYAIPARGWPPDRGYYGAAHRLHHTSSTASAMEASTRLGR